MNINRIMSNVMCRFSSMCDCNLNDGRISVRIPNTSLCINFILVEKEDDESTIKILKNSILKELHVSENSLMKIALKNTSMKEEVCYRSFQDIIGINDDMPNIIVTNKSLYYGSIALLYDGVCEHIRELIGDFYILPSSVHESICVPKNAGDKKELLHIVREINRSSFILKNDILADDVFEVVDGKICSAFRAYI